MLSTNPIDKASAIGIGGVANDQPKISTKAEAAPTTTSNQSQLGRSASAPDNHLYGTLSSIKEESPDDLLKEELSPEQVCEIEATVDAFLGKFTKDQKA